MNYSQIKREGSRWLVISGSDEKGAVVWAKYRSKTKAIEFADKLAVACKGEYRGERA